MQKKSTSPSPQTILVRDPDKGTFNLVTLYGPKLRAKKVAPPTMAPAAFEMPKTKQKVVILGAGISGLITAYYLLKSGKEKFDVSILEANAKVGGRSLTLRDGDKLTEVTTVNGRETKWEQTCKLEDEHPRNPEIPKPYLNAGPGRIPSGHFNMLNLCKELKVDLEVYIMESRSNRVYTNAAGKPMINRQMANDARGYIAQDLWEFIFNSPQPNEKYLDLLKNFGALTEHNTMRFTYQGSQRAGFEFLPGINQGKLAKPISKSELLKSGFWKVPFYQPEDFLWQATSFQPVGGMDMIGKALEREIKKLGGEIKIATPVNRVIRMRDGKWNIFYGSGRLNMEADICLCNIPIPLMKDKINLADFSGDFKNDFDSVIKNEKFLRPTCKVGWQAPRKLWQDVKNPGGPNTVIPIFGGISYIEHPMTQMWYPSDRFHDRLGVLTGAYNYDNNAERWGNLKPQDRLKEARVGAGQLHDTEFASGLTNGITIAWQNIPTQRGGWVDWQYVAEKPEEQARIMNTIRKGQHNFHVIGDQVSWLPGWKEGAAAVASEIFGVLTKVKDFSILEIEQVPNTAALVQGHMY